MVTASAFRNCAGDSFGRKECPAGTLGVDPCCAKYGNAVDRACERVPDAEIWHGARNRHG
ncbi:MAG: hypothetical protein U5O39_14760 [Gammaproteobacteria bacterium]|nr:hypothetical protein [Gammaproteobacteria bacterium]